MDEFASLMSDSFDKNWACVLIRNNTTYLMLYHKKNYKNDEWNAKIFDFLTLITQYYL